MAQSIMAKLAAKVNLMRDNGVDISVRTLAQPMLHAHQVFNHKGDRPLSGALSLEQLDTWVTAFAVGIAETRNAQQVEMGEGWLDMAIMVLRKELAATDTPCRVCDCPFPKGVGNT